MSQQNNGLRVFARHGSSLVALVRDVSDVLDAIAVAGLAWPDPALVGDLDGLAMRTESAGAPTGAGYLRSLSAALQCLTQATELSTRDRAGRVAFAELNHLVLWHQLFRKEVDAVAVQAHLLTHDDTTPTHQRQTPTLSGVVHWVGVLRDGETVRFFGLCDQRLVIFVDEWLGLCPSCLAYEPAVSRVFQARLRLAQVLSSGVRLTDFPVEVQQDFLLARPHFRSVPTLVKRSEDQIKIPKSTSDLAPVVVDGQLAREGSKVVLRVSGRRLTVSDTLTLTLTRFLLANGATDVSLVVLKRRDRMVLVGFQSEFDGLVFPHLDDHAFPLVASTLVSQLQVTDDWAAWSAALLGAPTSAPGLPDREESWEPRLGLWELSGTAPSRDALDWARSVLLRPNVENDVLWLALWALMLADELRTPQVSACWGRFSGSSNHGSGVDLSSVCIQALLMHAAGPKTAGDTTPSVALAWLDIQVSAMALDGEDAVLPGAKSLMQLARCLSWIAPSRSTHAETLGISLLQMRLLIVDTLWRAFALDEPQDRVALSRALWLMRFVDRPAAWFA